MGQPALLSVGITGLAVLAAVGLMFLWGRRRPIDLAEPHVRVLGAYSPILTWLRYRRQPGVAIQGAALAEAAARSPRVIVAPISMPAPGGAASAGLGLSLWDWLMDLPAAIQPWVRNQFGLQSGRDTVSQAVAQSSLPSADKPQDKDRAAEGALPGQPEPASNEILGAELSRPIDAHEPEEVASSMLAPAAPPNGTPAAPPPEDPTLPALHAPDSVEPSDFNVVTTSIDGTHVRVVLEIPLGTTVQITVETVPATNDFHDSAAPQAMVQVGRLSETAPMENLPLWSPPTTPLAIENVAGAMAATAVAEGMPVSMTTAVVAQPAARGRLAAELSAWRQRVALRIKALPLVTTVFALALVIYVITRLWGIDRFPVFFYSDEATYVLFAHQLVDHGFRGSDGQLLPLYFEVDNHRWAPETDIYFQMVTSTLFGNSIFIARATNALVSVLCVVAVGLILKRMFRARFWWAVVLILGIVPAYFLYSRVAFEMIIMASFFAAFLLCYLMYRTRSAGYLYLTLVMGAATFYAYSAAQPMMLLMGALLLLSDFRYHLANWRTGLKAVPLALLLMVPAVRFSLAHPGGIHEHLTSIASYWVADIPLAKKIGIFVNDYAYALSPQYWFLPNAMEDPVLPNQHIPGQANFGLQWLPLVLIGLWICLRHVRDPKYRTILLAALAVPAGTALDTVEIRRLLAMLVPMAVFVGLGLEWLMTQLEVRLRRFSFQQQTLTLFAVLAVANIWLLGDALVNIPKQYADYTLEGVQFGVKQIFEDTLPKYLQADKSVRILVSPVWANNTQEFPFFFYSASDQPRVTMGVIYDYLREKRDLTDTIMVMTAQEYDIAHTSPELKSLALEETLYYPNGQPSFYVTRPVYADNIDALIAAQKAERAKPLQTQLKLDGQLVTVTYSVLGSGDISAVFDGSTDSLVRGLEANPFVLGLSFPQPRAIQGAVLTTGSLDDFTVKVTLTPASGQPVTFQQTFRGLPADPTVTLTFASAPPLVTDIRFEIKNNLSGDVAQIHVRELVLR